MILKKKITISLDCDIISILEKTSNEKCINKSKFINKILKEYLKCHDIR